jgi:plastocyanin
MATLVINILPGANEDDPATFVPTLEDPGPNGEAYASLGDRVSWFNATKVTHELEATADDGTPISAQPRGSTYYLADPLPSGKPSRPGWIATPPADPPFPGAPPAKPTPPKAGTLCYRCRLHPKEDGKIIIT